MKFDIYGRKTLEVIRSGGCWEAFYCGNAGVKRRAEDIHIPAELSDAEIAQYIADVFHEWATAERGEVRRLS